MSRYGSASCRRSRRTPAEAAEEVVASILAGGPEAARVAKSLVRERPSGLETAHIAAKRRASPEGQDGLRAFLEHRAPAWTQDEG